MVLMRFTDFVRTLTGSHVDLMIRGIADLCEDGTAMVISGKMFAGEDFVVLQGADEGPPTAIRIADILMVQVSTPGECDCEASGSDEKPNMSVEDAFESLWQERRKQKDDQEG